MHSSVGEACDGIAKVLGGGPESIGEFGATDEITHQDPAVTPTVAAGSDVASKADVAKAVQEAIADLLPQLTKALGKEEKPAVVVPVVPPAEEKITKADIATAVAGAFGEFVKALTVAPDAPKPGVGDRGTAKPFTKAEDGGTGAAGQTVIAVGMQKADWDAYRQGDPKAMRKAQDLTSTKWTVVPERIMRRMP